MFDTEPLAASASLSRALEAVVQRTLQAILPVKTAAISCISTVFAHTGLPPGTTLIVIKISTQTLNRATVSTFT